MRTLGQRWFPERRWRAVQLGALAIRIPPGWGDPEADPQGGFVIHNRPRAHRTDGDAVWYSSAIELRIMRATTPEPRSTDAMTVTCRTIEAPEPVRLILAVANGVGPRQRRVAERVLRGVRPLRTVPAQKMAWPEISSLYGRTKASRKTNTQEAPSRTACVTQSGELRRDFT